jgi:hypothetical protein
MARLTVAWVPHTLLRPRAYLDGPSVHKGSTCGPCCRSKASGKKSAGDGGAILVMDGISLRLCRLVLAWTRLGVESEQRQ